jgi:hydroxymethylpyrimidine pyrophosphatase-like HAD family hydrolase
MTERGVIFCDVDGTLCFHEGVHGVRQVGSNPDGTVQVTAGDGGRSYAAHDLSVGGYRAFMSVETRALCHRLRPFFHLVLVTGGRLRTLRRRSAALDFADAAILENGGVIVDAALRVDEGWSARLEPDRRVLGEVAARLRNAGWVLDDAGRSSAIRVRQGDNPHRSPDQFQALAADPRLPPSLRATRNLGHIDIIPRAAGKANAVRYLAAARGAGLEGAVGIGDDVNDIDFLRAVGRPHVLASAMPELLRVAGREGWTISDAPLFEGIHQILRDILAACRA